MQPAPLLSHYSNPASVNPSSNISTLRFMQDIVGIVPSATAGAPPQLAGQVTTTTPTQADQLLGTSNVLDTDFSSQ
jgi:hypothetical protein